MPTRTNCPPRDRVRQKLLKDGRWQDGLGEEPGQHGAIAIFDNTEPLELARQHHDQGEREDGLKNLQLYGHVPMAPAYLGNVGPWVVLPMA